MLTSRTPMGCSAGIVRPAATIGGWQRPGRQRHLRSRTRADPDGPIQRIISLGLFTGLTQDFEPQPSRA